MTTIGDRIRIRRIKGKRGDRYSLCQEQPSRASEPNQDIPEEKEQEVERVETRAETNPQRQKDHYHIDFFSSKNMSEAVPRFQLGRRSIITDIKRGAEAGVREGNLVAGNY